MGRGATSKANKHFQKHIAESLDTSGINDMVELTNGRIYAITVVKVDGRIHSCIAPMYSDNTALNKRKDITYNIKLETKNQIINIFNKRNREKLLDLMVYG